MRQAVYRMGNVVGSATTERGAIALVARQERALGRFERWTCTVARSFTTGASAFYVGRQLVTR